MHIAAKVMLRRLRHDAKQSAPKLAKLLVVAAISVLTIVIVGGQRNREMETSLLKQWFAVRGPLESSKQVVIARLDNAAYKAAGARTSDVFPREKLAAGIERLAKLNTPLLIVDLIFDHEGNDLQSNAALAQSLKSVPSVIGRYTQHLRETDPDGNKRPIRNIIKPTRQFSDASDYVAAMSVRAHNDVVTEISLLPDDTMTTAVPLLDPLKKFVSPETHQPAGRDLLNCYGPPGSIPSFSFAKLLTDPELFDSRWTENRVVLIGQMNEAGVGISKAKDTLFTACTSQPVFGVEIHGTIVANLLAENWIKRSSAQTESLASTLFVCLIAFIILQMSARSTCILSVSVVVGLLGCSYLAFVHYHLFLPVAFVACVALPLLALLRLGAIGFHHYRSNLQLG